ncbi:flavodoxin family protein [Burkholderia sp. JPY481]
MLTAAIVYHSGYGHTEAVAAAVARGVEADGVSAVLIPVEQIDAQWDLLEHRADAIIFGAPTYMGSVSASFKQSMDSSSKVWGKWRDKLGAGFTVSASQSGDKLATLQRRHRERQGNGECARGARCERCQTLGKTAPL